MNPNFYMDEQFMREHRQNLLDEAELKRRLEEAQPAHQPHW